MKKTLAAVLALVAAGAAAVPAMADDDRYRGRYDDRRYDDRRYDGYGYGDRRHDDRYDRGRYDYRARADRLDARIDAGVRSGQLTRSESARLYAELNYTARLEQRYRADGRFTEAERRALDQRLDQVQARLRYERRDDDRYYGQGYGYRR